MGVIVEHRRTKGLLLLKDFVNTIDLNSGVDQIDNPDGLRMWFAERNLINPSTLGDADVRRAQDLRESIRELLFAHGSTSMDPGATAIIRSIWEEGELVFEIDSTGSPQLLPRSMGFAAGLGALASVLLLAMHSDEWNRLKVCGNIQCQRVFYDRSRNRSGKWCQMASCGNRMKVRAYRMRKRLLAEARG